MFYSILFPTREQYDEPRQTDVPVCFKDLNLDQVFAPIFKAKKDFPLEPLFYTPLNNSEVITYRQNIMHELADENLRGLFSDFSASIYRIRQFMNSLRSAMSSEDRWSNNYLARGRMLDFAGRYCHTITTLMEKLSKQTFHAEGLLRFKNYLATYCASDAYQSLTSRIIRLRDNLSTIQYCMMIGDGTVRVRKYEGQTDQSSRIIASFEKFRQGDVKDYRKKLSEDPYADHVEAAVINLVANIYPDIFDDLNRFCSKYFQFDDETIFRFSQEIQFYLSWHDLIAPLRSAGLPFCYPKLCDTPDHLYNSDGFDLALALREKDKIVVNDFELTAPERVIVVTGPNQGGKTTFARFFGQVHYLTSLGVCVPGRKAALYLYDNLLTHFGREEDLSTLNGKLQDDLERLHTLLNQATSRSILVINEIFASTTVSDALLLGGKMMDKLATLGAPTVFVTFLDELALHGPETVSMMSEIRENDPTERSFKIIRKPPDGLAYANHIAKKYRLTYKELGRRIRE